jgi:hypothetical protein
MAQTQTVTLHVAITAAGFPVEDDVSLPRQLLSVVREACDRTGQVIKVQARC